MIKTAFPKAVFFIYIIMANKTLSEFKQFILKGNVLDMAVGIIVGGAFNKIVSSLVNDIIMPPIGYLIGGVNFSELKARVGGPESEVYINYGNFIQEVINFLIIALTVFVIVKAVVKMSNLRKAEEGDAKK